MNINWYLFHEFQLKLAPLKNPIQDFTNFANSRRHRDSVMRVPQCFEGLTIGACLALIKPKSSWEERTKMKKEQSHGQNVGSCL
jgi:hypothetical protein